MGHELSVAVDQDEPKDSQDPGPDGNWNLSFCLVILLRCWGLLCTQLHP